MFNTDPDRSTKEILEDIKQAAVGSYSQSDKIEYAGTIRGTNCKTEQGCGEHREKLIILTRWLITLTILLIIVTIPLAIDALKHFSKLGG